MVTNKARYDEERRIALSSEKDKSETHPAAKFMVFLTPVAFIAVIALMLAKEVRGGDATAMITGTAMVLMTIGAVLQHGLDALEKIVDYVRDGFGFGMKIFAPVVIIGGFFFIGGSGVSAILQGDFQQGLLMDWGWWLAGKVPLSKYPVATLMLVIGGITGLDGSGFSGLPLVGSMALSFGEAVNLNIPVLAAIRCV